MRMDCERVGVLHGPARALAEVSLSLAPGEHVLLCGPAGSGKTTLLKVLAGLLRPTSGAVRWDGEDVAHLDEAGRRRRQASLGMVFQTDALFDSRTVLENVLLPLHNRGVGREEARARAEAALEAVGLLQAARMRPEALSGGMRKRAGIARALVVAPEVLFADDPLAGQDPATARALCELLDRQAAGRTLVVSSPEPPPVLTIQRWWVVDGGRLVHDGPPAPALIGVEEGT
ncbi:MAG: ATP-binding cassette domain-containing protein [Deltaproteobacteria bacterium]|nr:ATP-binding cassette domain-containing protein [Deltaproteobacteria bacterium]